jgi:hypothetical protein
MGWFEEAGAHGARLVPRDGEPVTVLEVTWHPRDRTYSVRARGVDDTTGEPDTWGGPDDVPEGELDIGLGIARDIITGG